MNGGRGVTALLLSLVAAPLAQAEDTERDLQFAVNGDVKSFFVASFPSQWFGIADDAAPFLELAGMTEDQALEAYGLSADAFATGSVNARLKLEAVHRDDVRLDVHYALNVSTVGAAAVIPGMSTGAGLGAPEVIKLTSTYDTSGLAAQGRFDRLVFHGGVPHLDVAIGRQPISFGTGMFFTPMDLVNPFHPATIDTEYKPGVDALRVDLYGGVSTKATLAIAYAGDDPLIGVNRREDAPIGDDLVVAVSGQTTIVSTDVLVFVGAVHGEPVVGLGTESGIGPVAVHAEATLTLPDQDDPYLRAVAGAMWLPTGTTTLMGEVYVQSFGASDPSDYLAAVSSLRFARGEIWQLGRTYAALSVAQELTPLIHANGAVIANLEDPSGLVVGGLSWSVADNVAVAAGTYIGVGERPEQVDLSLDTSSGAPTLAMPSADVLGDSVHSEFGLYPTSLYLQLKTYF